MFDFLMDLFKNFKKPEQGGTRQKKFRTPFGSSRERGPGPQRMIIEEFSDKEERNERFHQLRKQGTPHVSKFSTVKNNKSVWCVVRP